MLFTKIRLAGKTNVDLPIVGALPSDTYILKDASGLGPPDVIVTIMNGVYQSSLPSDRELVFRVGLNPNYGVNQTAEQLRTELYKLLVTGYGKSISVQIMNDNAVKAKADGYVRKIEIVPFSKEPEVQITFASINSYLVAPNAEVVVPAGISTFQVINVGTARTGFRAEFNITGTINDFTLTSTDEPDLYMIIDGALISGDILVIDTRSRYREISMVRDGDYTNRIGDLMPDSSWLDLDEGLNTFDTSSNKFTWGSVTFTPQYWGV